MTPLKLTYFDFSGGRGEPIRLALHLGGVPFEDHRFAPATFPEIRKTAPLGQVPIVHLGDTVVTQGDAILRYAGKLGGLYPQDAEQALYCDEVLSGLEDITIKISATFGLKGEDMRRAREALAAEVLPKYLRWLAGRLEGRGGAYFADQRLTIADLKALVILRWISSGSLDHIPTDIVASAAPSLKEYMDRIGSTPAIVQYYAARSGK
ncbi:MAG: glutathione S-transferase family protein [Rhodocyclaceae bacterium]|nr:glutathione S-transferase family protein [Rhodocyclaceae bacterium]MBX3667312.1 glutathione S-transferase family protein [Rhodocyclaceae bacterium]